MYESKSRTIRASSFRTISYPCSSRSKRTTLQSMVKRFGLPLPRDAAKSNFHAHASRPCPERLHDKNWAAG